MAAKKKASQRGTKKTTKRAPARRATKKAVGEKFVRTEPTAIERFVSGNYSEADLEPVLVKCPACGKKGLKPVKGRFGPVWRCLQHPKCKQTLDARPTGKSCRHRTDGKACGALMVEGTKTIPDRCSDRSCPNRNPHRL